MKAVPILVYCILSCASSIGQNLSKKLLTEQNALMISLVNYSKDTCIKVLYIGKNDTLYYPCVYRKDCVPVSISSDRILVNQLIKIMNMEFFKKLEKCCEKRDCSDVGNDGYIMEIKSNGVDEGFGVNLNDYNKGICVSKDLKKIIDILNTIILKYK